MIKLGVNIDHIATLRQARREGAPSVVEAALVCEKAGADGITVHLREDRRHIQDYDVYSLREILKTKLNLEMAATEEVVGVALDVKPDSVCIVPEKREELTTEGGLDVKNNKETLSSIISKLKKAGIVVSIFIDADLEQVSACSEVGADAVELHTGKYSLIFKESGSSSRECKGELKRITEASKEALKRKLILNAGHGLDYENVGQICKIHGMNEFNIGFSIISKAIFDGLQKAVFDMRKLIQQNSNL
ncbi:MAG: pyridoxine 5'-phosphate synthase [Endomicrobium sp.]|jgi:pyridoxine 5-phosphate synthase|uniref:pyridoxine 5'-phosphate synthase n=1 Tax=Candidatus Endomicrobiellum devescovinae TaxID=3242322 RepID=UPI002837B59D|nr:pyridoxine 5'-phosphate synthase [Endomicrobium sp.]MDR1434160.1 pyridoxine 5'-phosphate synthase [Endomicrobium sp.]MDR2251662.1 pyridoxine 5'-phosphate synthase [Endomicrobium sp.]MDR2818662.1 pyridoxine 5'-phosphate synthase [Endomicrobium sp.]